MKANNGWRIHDEAGDICATFWSDEKGDVMTINGFASRTEASMFLATYITMMATAQSDKATRMLHEFVSRVKPS